MELEDLVWGGELRSPRWRGRLALYFPTQFVPESLERPRGHVLAGACWFCHIGEMCPDVYVLRADRQGMCNRGMRVRVSRKTPTSGLGLVASSQWQQQPDLQVRPPPSVLSLDAVD